MIAGCWPPMDHFDHSFPFEHLIPIFVTVCGPGQAGDRWRAANYQFRLHGSDIYSFYSLTKSPFVTRTWEDSPVLTTSPLSGSQQFPHYGPLTGPALDLWISGVTNEVKLSCDVWWCLVMPGEGSDQWSLVTGPLGAAPTCIPHSGCLPQLPGLY